MCTLILAWQQFEAAPLCVAANRDEADDRPADPPGVYATEPRIVAPRDREAGGTWIGYNESGVVAAVTNRWTGTALDADRSRGLLVADALERPSAEAATRFVEHAVERDAYDAFNLVLADETAALYVEWDGTLSVRNFDPGIHVVVNVGADGDFAVPPERHEAARRQVDGALRARTDLQPEPGESVAAWRARAADVLADHDYGFCVHGDGYGTRSSSLLTLDGAVEWRFADGPPCRTDHRRVDGQL